MNSHNPLLTVHDPNLQYIVDAFETIGVNNIANFFQNVTFHRGETGFEGLSVFVVDPTR